MVGAKSDCLACWLKDPMSTGRCHVKDPCWNCVLPVGYSWNTSPTPSHGFSSVNHHLKPGLGREPEGEVLVKRRHDNDAVCSLKIVLQLFRGCDVPLCLVVIFGVAQKICVTFYCNTDCFIFLLYKKKKICQPLPAFEYK